MVICHLSASRPSFSVPKDHGPSKAKPFRSNSEPKSIGSPARIADDFLIRHSDGTRTEAAYWTVALRSWAVTRPIPLETSFFGDRCLISTPKALLGHLAGLAAIARGQQAELADRPLLRVTNTVPPHTECLPETSAPQWRSLCRLFTCSVRTPASCPYISADCQATVF
jgi:hypothetical protein